MFHVKHLEQLEIDAKYEVYLSRQAADIAAFRRDESLELPDDIDYGAVKGLSNEARAKLAAIRPRTIGQAGRIDGLTPAALTLLVGHLRRGESRKPPRRRRARWRAALAKPDLTADRAEALGSPLFHVKHWRASTCSSRLLLTWNARHQSDRASTVPHLWTRHIADSLQLLDLAPNARVWVDLGSGAGFPGLVIACALADTPGAKVHLVESNTKKAAFLREAVRITGAPAVVHRRADRKICRQLSTARADVVTARALAPLKILLDQSVSLLKTGAIGLFPKGQDVEAELTEATKYWNIKVNLVPSRTDSKGRIVVVRAGTTRGGGQSNAASRRDGRGEAKAMTQSGIIGDESRRSDLQRRVRPSRPPRVLAIANQKGGVGKTTTAINLGTALAAIGEHVLIVDLDPQGNASTGLGIDRKTRRYSTYDVLTGEATLRDAVLPTAVPRLSIAPSTLDLSGLELEIGQERDRAFRLRNALAPLNAHDAPASPISPMCWSTVRRRSIFSPSMRWRRRTRSWCRCNASSSRSKDCRNCSRPSIR